MKLFDHHCRYGFFQWASWILIYFDGPETSSLVRNYASIYVFSNTENIHSLIELSLKVDEGFCLLIYLLRLYLKNQVYSCKRNDNSYSQCDQILNQFWLETTHAQRDTFHVLTHVLQIMQTRADLK